MQFKSLQTASLTMALAMSGVLGLLPGSLPQAQAVVVGQDHRPTPAYDWLTSSGQPRKAVGQLEMQRQDGLYQRCTFTVVGRNLGLTNASCVMDEYGRPMRSIRAFAARYGNNPNGTTRYFASATVDHTWQGLTYSPSTPADYAKDWAIIRFTTNLGDVTGWFGNEAYGDGGSSMVGRLTNYIGYGSDWPRFGQLRVGDVRGATPALHAGCRIIGQLSGSLLHDCDTASGADGANLYNRVTDSNLRMMGLNAANGWVLTNGQVANTAVPLDAFMPTLTRLRQSGGQ